MGQLVSELENWLKWGKTHMFGIRMKSRESKTEVSLYVEAGSSLVAGWGWGTGSDSWWVRGISSGQ